MALSFTYNTLIAALNEWTEDDSAELTTSMPTIVSAGETRVLKDLRLSFLDTTSAISFVSGTATVTKPASVVATLALWYTASGADYFIQPRSYEFVKDFTPATTTTGLPLYYAENSETTYLMAPTPNFTGSGNARCIVRPTGLSSGNQTTWIGTNAGEALFYSCLIAIEQFLKTDLDNPSRIKMWREEYDKAMGTDLRELADSVRATYPALAPAPKLQG